MRRSISESMKTRWNIVVEALCCFSFVLGLVGCGPIDEDLSDCGIRNQLDYELRLVTNMTTELQTHLTAQTDVTVSNMLRTHLGGVFSDFAHDVDLSFYDVVGDSVRLDHDVRIMDANQTSYTLYLPVRRYMHTAIANLKNNEEVILTDDEFCHQSRLTLAQPTADTIRSHTTGLFTARLPMEVQEGIDQVFNVRLYMANCAAALIADTTGTHIRDLRVCTSGFATGFSICDSVYLFSEQSPVVQAERLDTLDSSKLCFCSVNFPSPEPEEDVEADDQTRVVIETTDPFASLGAKHPLWHFICYVTLDDGTVTRTVLDITRPLRAGQLYILTANVQDDGIVSPKDKTVGVSVTLNWNTIEYPEIPL